MVHTNAVESAEDVRKSGNELHKTGKLLEAVACYKHAAELAPSEAAPLSNLSAAYFELGQYSLCRETCQAALKLLNNGNDLSAQKLHLRPLKASLLLKDIDYARDSLASLDPNEERHRLEKSLGLIEDNSHGGLDIEMRIISDLPKTKATTVSVRTEESA
jgi:tetratricopeptide (TPR) repeat protein